VNIIITGASDGIGLQIAQLLNKPGVSLLLVGKRDAANVQSELAVKQHYLSANLDGPAGIECIAQAIDDLGWDGIDMIIHNAAIGWIGQSKDQPWSSIDELLCVNCVAPIAITHRQKQQFPDSHEIYA